MASKKPKEPNRGTNAQAQKREAVVDQLPGQLEERFRRSLGRHNLHFNMLEVSVQTFANTLSRQPSEAVYIRGEAKKVGFHSLYPDVAFSSARAYLIYSHIAYVFNAGDVLCEAIRSTSSMKALKGNHPVLFNEIDTGDFVRKTVALAVLANMPLESRNAISVNTSVEELVKTDASFALVDYFRIVRNEELHGAGVTGPRVLGARSALSEDRIRGRYRDMPSAGALNARDALLCSKAWQGVAEWLCRHMLNDAEAKALLKERFGRLEATRRETAARRFLELQLLYSKDDINSMLFALGW
jgi:hypothetical protein